nr:unnamed protein product [Leishmania braziliensis]
MDAKHRHSEEELVSPYYSVMPAPLQGTEEVLKKRRWNHIPSSPSLKRSAGRWSRPAVEADATATSMVATGKARQPTSQKSSKLVFQGNSSASPSSRGIGEVMTALQESPGQEAPFNDDDGAPSSTDPLFESSRASSSVVALPSGTSDGGYFLPEWSIVSETAPVASRTVVPLKCPPSEPRCHSCNSASSAVPHVSGEPFRERMDRRSSCTQQSHNPCVRDTSPQSGQEWVCSSSAIPSPPRSHSQYYMTSSNSSSLRFGTPYQFQAQQKEQHREQRRVASMAPPELNPEEFTRMFPMEPFRNPHGGPVDICEALRAPRSRFGAVNGVVPATIIKRGDSSKLSNYSSITCFNGGHTDSASPLRERQRCQPVDAAPLGVPSAAGIPIASRPAPPSFHRVLVSINRRTPLRSATSGFESGSLVWQSMYGTNNDRNGEWSSTELERQGMSTAGRSVVCGGYQSFFHSTTGGHLTLSESDPSGGGAGADENPARRCGEASSLYGRTPNSVAVVSSPVSGDEGGNEDSEDVREQCTSDKRVSLEASPRPHDTSPLQNGPISVRSFLYGSGFESCKHLAPKSSMTSAAFMRQSGIFGGSTLHDDSNDEDDGYRVSPSTDSSQCCTLDRKGTMTAFGWVMETGKGRLRNKEGGTRGDCASDDDEDGNIAEDKEDDVDGDDDANRRLSSTLTCISRCNSHSKTAHHNSKVMVRSNANSDEDADEDGDGEDGPTSQSRQTALERIQSDKEELSDSSEADDKVEVREGRPAVDTVPSLPPGGGGSSNVYRRVGPSVANYRRSIPIHYYVSPRANVIPPTGYPGRCAGCGAHAAAYLHNCGCYQRLNLARSRQDERNWHAQPTGFVSSSPTNSSGEYTSSSAGTTPVTYESTPPMFRRTATSTMVHKLLGLDPEAEIIRVRSPLWWCLPR